MKLRKILCFVMSFIFMMTSIVLPAYANGNDEELFTESVKGEIPQELIWDKKELDRLTPSDISFYTYPVAVGTSSEKQIGYIRIEDENNRYTQGLILLTGDMLDNFDSSSKGKKSFNLSFGVWQSTVEIEIVENADMKTLGKPNSIKARAGFTDSKGISTLPVGGKFQFGEIDILDDLGNTIYRVELKEKDILNFDSSKRGVKKYSISYNGFTTELVIEFHQWIYILKPIWNEENDFVFPIGTDLTKQTADLFVYDSDDNNHPLGITPGIGFASSTYLDNLLNMIDTSKAGTYQIKFKIDDADNGIQTVNAKVIIGMPNRSTIEELLPKEAQSTIPCEDVLGVWEVPSGEAGAGTWIFDTGLTKGNKVDVWTYHNGEWLSIGSYSADDKGCILVTFNSDQLSPVLITKGVNKDASSNQEINNESNENHFNDKDVIKNTGAHTSDYHNMLTIIGMLLVTAIIFQKKSNKQTNLTQNNK